MDLLAGILGYVVKTLIMSVAIVAGVFAGKSFRDYKDAKKAAETSEK